MAACVRYVPFRAMPDNDLDPGASTQMFQAFVDSPEPESSGPRLMWTALAVVVLTMVPLLAWLLLGGG